MNYYFGGLGGYNFISLVIHNGQGRFIGVQRNFRMGWTLPNLVVEGGRSQIDLNADWKTPTNILTALTLLLRPLNTQLFLVEPRGHLVSPERVSLLDEIYSSSRSSYRIVLAFYG